MTTETENMIEVVALRVAQESITDEARIAQIVRSLRLAFPEWRQVYGPEVLSAVCERFEVPFTNATSLYLDAVAAAA